MAKPDSKAELGKGIADDLESDDEEDEEGSEEDSDSTDDSEGEDAAGTSGKPDEGKPEGQKKGEKDEDEDSKSEPPLTRAEAKELVDQAVSSAVGKANSSKDKEMATLRKESRDESESLRREVEEARLQGLPEVDKTAMRQVQSNDRAQREIKAQREEAGDMVRLANAARLGVDQSKFGKYGATVAELEDCDSPEAQESLCQQKERDYWKGVATGEIKIDEDLSSDASKNGKGKKARTKADAPAGSKKSTDVGGGGAAPPKGEEVTTLDSFAQSLMNSGVVPAGGITRVEEKTK